MWTLPISVISAKAEIHRGKGGILLILLFWQWRPLPAVVWHVDHQQIVIALMGLSFVGWLRCFRAPS
jgi:hypothetical protein